MAERDDRHRLHHHPEEGEGRRPTGEPHDPLATPEEETPDVVGRAPEPDGMGKRPPARGERRASHQMPDAEE
jgi:hypothetical protein